MRRVPNTHSPEEVRRAFKDIQVDMDVLLQGAVGEVLIGAGTNITPAWTTSLSALTYLKVDSIIINDAIISSSSGAISFSDENLSTTGTVSGVNVTSGENPGHTHTGTSLSAIDISDDTNLAATSPIVLTGDTLSLNQGAVDHGSIGGLADDDHTQYHNDTRGDARYYTETELNNGQLDNRYFTESEHLNASSGATDAGKPIKLDAAGHVDATMVNDGDIDHGSIGGLTDDDHTLYSKADGTRAFSGVVGGVTPVSNADLATKGYVDTAVGGAQTAYSAVIDEDGTEGQVVYIKATGHFGLAIANSAGKERVLGFLDDDYASGATATCIPDGNITVSAWSLAPASVYYLAKTDTETLSYANPGGTGDRTVMITVTGDIPHGGAFSSLVNGAGTDLWCYDPVAGKYIRFDFGAGVKKRITEAKWYQDNANTHGTWKWQGSQDASAWTDIGVGFTLGGSMTQTLTELSGNAGGYRYYQLLGVSGTANIATYMSEIEFKLDDYVAKTPGEITLTPPSTVGEYITRVGVAVTEHQLDIEIADPILL